MTSSKQVRTVGSLVATLFLFSASLSSAQTQLTVPTLQNASPVAAPGYLALSLDEGSELQVRLSDNQAKGSSPKFQTVGLKQGQTKAGFRTVHANTSLTEILDYYWNTLTELSFESSVETMSRFDMVYAFENGNRAVTAVFSQQGNSIVADLSWALYDGMKLSGRVK